MRLPNLKPFHQAKVDSSNALLRFVVELLFLSFQMGVHVVPENPERSWIWAALTNLVLRKDNRSFCSWYNGLRDVIFDACEHGGARPKSTKFATTLKVCCNWPKGVGRTMSTLNLARFGTAIAGFLIPAWKQNIHYCYAKGMQHLWPSSSSYLRCFINPTEPISWLPTNSNTKLPDL